MAEVIMPKMGDGMSEGTLLSWKKQDGDQVRAGEVIAEIETDKSNVEIEAEDAGILRTKTAVGQTVPVGTVIAVIGDAKANGNGNGTAAKAVQEAVPSTSNGAKPEPVSGGEGLTVEIRSTEREDMARAIAGTHAEGYTGETVHGTYRDGIRMALEEELDRDVNVFLLGEEIGQYQGTFKITKGFLEKYGADRIVDTPISEAGMVGLTTGAAMMGMRPVIEFMTLNFALVAWDQIINHTAKIRYMSGGQYSVPCVLRGPAGVGVQLSAQHSQDLAHWYAFTPGLKVVVPSTPADA